MGAKADHDLWGQIMAAERRYGDRAPELVARKAQALRRAGEYSEADFWMQVAECLTDLHAIKFAGAGKAAGHAAGRRNPQNGRPAAAPRMTGTLTSDPPR